jgi:hypothetical protein
MKPRLRRLAVFAGTAVLAAGAGIGVAATNNDSSSGGSSSRSAPGVSRPQQGAPGGMDVSALADALGVSETRLQQAMRAARPTDPSAGGGPDEMIQALADELGLSADKVRQAFEDTLGNAGPPSGDGQTAPSSSGSASLS